MDIITLSLIIISLVLALHGRCIDGYNRKDFPDGFVFGSAISAYQWEGAFNVDGKKPSVWDTFVHSRTTSNGDIACDGYHKYKEDVQLMEETGLHALRFSISWSRLIPNGRGPINPKGLHFYKNFIQELVSHGIQPHVTLYHFDHPQYLEDEYGGWLNRRIIEDFTAYADVCFREFGNHVKFWNTINEANIFAVGGYSDGITPPGHCSVPGTDCIPGNSSTEPYIVGHNLLLAHASASRLYKQKYKEIQGGSIGFSLYEYGYTPLTNSKEDEMAVQRAKDFFFGWMLGPLTYGDYPDVMKQTLGSRLPVFSEEESELVKGSFEFLGIIHYIACSVSNINLEPSPSRNPDFYSDMGVSMTCFVNLSTFEHVVAPWAMEDVLDYIKQSYGNPPIYILENGTPMKQLQHDTPRIEFLDAYIGVVLKAIRNGSNTRGYFVWSFMDVYELLDGYNYSYGLYNVNFSDPHLKRTPKLSAQWYSAFLKDNKTFLSSEGIKNVQSNITSSS